MAMELIATYSSYKQHPTAMQQEQMQPERQHVPADSVTLVMVGYE